MRRLLTITERLSYRPAEEATDRPNLIAISGSRGSLAVDAGNSPAHAAAFAAAVAEHGLPALRYVALTHWHWDHVFGLATLDLPALAHAETARQVAHQSSLDWSDGALDQRVADGSEIEFCRDMIRAELPDRSGLVIATPDITFEDEVQVDLGGLTARIVHVGGDHGNDCSVVYVPEERVLLLGDCLGPDLYHGPYAYTRSGLLGLLDKLLSFGARWYLHGHSIQPTTAEEFSQMARRLRVIGELVGVHGDAYSVIAAGFRERMGREMDEEDWEDAGYFMAGEARAGVDRPD